jgi:hypothetical protein
LRKDLELADLVFINGMVFFALKAHDEFVCTPFSWERETDSLGDGTDLILLQQAMLAVRVATVIKHKDIRQITSQAVKALLLGALAE